MINILYRLHTEFIIIIFIIIIFIGLTYFIFINF